MSDGIERLMSEAGTLAERARQIRKNGTVKTGTAELRDLEARLSRVWTDIRMARASVGTVTEEMRHRPKWE